MSKYQYTDDMAEISGFGGGYEATCRKMVVAGLEWWDSNPEADPKFHGYKHIYGVIIEDNDDAKKLSEAIIASATDATGAMHQAAVTHVLRIHKVGWDTYVKEMQELKLERTKEIKS